MDDKEVPEEYAVTIKIFKVERDNNGKPLFIRSNKPINVEDCEHDRFFFPEVLTTDDIASINKIKEGHIAILIITLRSWSVRIISKIYYEKDSTEISRVEGQEESEFDYDGRKVLKTVNVMYKVDLFLLWPEAKTPTFTMKLSFPDGREVTVPIDITPDKRDSILSSIRGLAPHHSLLNEMEKMLIQ